MASASVAGKSKQSKSDPNWGDGPLATAPSDPNSSPAPPSLYESQKLRDWNTFLQYLRNLKPPITLAGCRSNHVIDFLRYLDQFGKTKVHLTLCPFFGRPDPPAPCPCPLRQAWGSLDALIGRLRLAYEEHGGSPESNPFATKAVRDYLSEVRECQAKARGNTTGTGSDGDGSGSDASRASLSSTSANDQAQPSNNNMVRNPKARSRVSRRAPTTVLTTDSTNFRAMVNEFTGIPAPPFTFSEYRKIRPQFGKSSSRDSPELLKRQDWNTFLRYLGNQKPPITLAECSENHVLGFLKYLDQFGEVKVHYPRCLLFGHPNPVAACACPLWQASGSLDALIERLRSAYVEHGGRPESNPFAAGAVWDYLSEVRESQAKARGNTTGTGSDGDGSGSAAQTTSTPTTRREKALKNFLEKRRQRQSQSYPMMSAAGLTRKGIVLGKMGNLSKDNEPVIDTFQKALPKHHNPDTLKKLNDAEKAKRELEQQEYFDTKLANEEHEKEIQDPPTDPFWKNFSEYNEPDIEIFQEAGGEKMEVKWPTTAIDSLTTSTIATVACCDGDGSGSAAQTISPTTSESEEWWGQINFTDFDTVLANEEHEKEEKTEDEVASEPHGMVIDVKEVKMTNSSGQKKFEIEEIGNKASSQLRQPEGIQVEEMQLQASSTLKPQGVVFDVEAVKILKSSEMEPEASEQHGLFLMQGGLGLTKPPKDEDWKNAKEIYLMDNELSDLPENPRCPNLSALFLPRNYKLRMIPELFFNFMPALQILNLSRTGIKSLPDSLIRLVSLKRLFLNNCHRLMILSPKVGDLKQLEVLDLEGANIMDLPKEIKNLSNLTCLEVSFYGFTSNGSRTMQSNAVVPCGVLSALSQLEELNIDVNPDDERWDACVEDIVNEVCTLKRLETLKFYFPRVELLSHFLWNSLLLPNFRFTVGHHVKRIMSRVPPDAEFELERWERCLKYINGVGVHRDIKKLLQHVTAFFLDRHATIKKLSDFGTGNMKQLKCCVVGECNELQVIIDAADAYGEDGEDGISEIVSESYDAERIVLGSLEHLYIYYMKSLRSIWEGPVQQNSLFLLKSLTLSTCPQLTTIFTQGLLDNLCNLGELKVEYCHSIKSIVSCEISAEHGTSYFLPNLKKISLHCVPGLVSISNGLHIAPKLEWLSFYNCPNLKNPLIDEVSSQDLKKIKGERRWWEELEWSNGRPGYLDEIFVPIEARDF